MENNKTPSIRFKGFTDPWEQRKLLSCIEKITDFRGRTPKKLGMDWSESGYLALSALNVKDGYIDFSQDVHYGEQALYDKWMSGNELHKGQVLFTTEAPMGNVAQVPDNKRYILSQRTIAFDVKEDIITENFLATLLRSPAVFNTLTSLSSGGTAKGVSQKSLAGVDIQIPVELREQELLATYFANLDNLITLHQRKYNKLLNVKKSMLEKMFPKNGSNIPEIRFKGFTDPWEQRKVLDLLELLTDYDANGSFADMAKNINTTDGDGYAWYVRITDLENPKPLSELKYVDESSYEFLKKTELHGGELLMAKRGNIGKVYIFEPRTKYATVAPNMYLLKLNNKVIPHFLYDYFVSEEGNKKLTRLNASSTMGALYKDDVKNIDVIMPSIEEQAMIGNFFQSIDHIITLHQRELEKLQNIKKSMLEKMFV